MPWQKETSGTKKRGRISPDRWCVAFLTFLLTAPVQGQTKVSGDTYLEPYESIEISSTIVGVIEDIMVKEGDYVKKGQTLISLNADVIKAQYEVAKARAEAQGRIMAAQAERDQQANHYSLLSQVGANSAEKKREYAKLQALEGNLVAAREDAKINSLDAVRIRAELNDRILKTPIDGHVVSITKDVAEPVSINRSDPNNPDYLVRVVNIKKLRATGFLPYKAVRHITLGDKLSVTSSDVDEEWKTMGTVEFISPIIDPATGTKEIRIMIENSDLVHDSGVPARIVVELPDNS